jgi:hypothetical protein
MKGRTLQLKQLGSQIIGMNGLQAGGLTRKGMIVACLLIFSLAVSVRLLQWQNNWLIIDHTMSRLTAQYKEEAQFLLDGNIKAFFRGSLPQPDTSLLTHPPGYPMLIFLIYKLSGNSDTALRLFQILCDAGAAVLVLLLAARLLPKGAAIIAAVLVALSPQLSFNSLLLLPDSISGFFILLAVYLIVRARERPQITTILAAGASVGVSCWFRANALLLAPFLCLIIPVLFERGKRLRYSFALVGATVLVILPITIRNAIVFRSFIPVSLNAGLNLVEGIADYDPEKRFGLEATDDGVMHQEAELYNRPDYAKHLFRPDGIERERARFARALPVIRANKIWFLGVMLRRAASMLEYDIVPIVSVEPSVTHSVERTDQAELAWTRSPAELMTDIPSVSTQASSSLAENQQSLSMMGDDSEQGKQFASAPIGVQRKSDYLLRLPVSMEQGRMVIKVESADERTTLASATIPDSVVPTAPTKDSLTFVQLPFVTSNVDQVRIVLSNAQSKAARPIMHIGGMELFRLGPASYLWTRYPRILVKSGQKFFKTSWMLPLTLLGIMLLALAGRGQVLAVTLIVPAYYLCMHSPLHVESRYLLAMNYFMLMLAAAAIYWIVIRLWQLVQRLKLSRQREQVI